MKLYGKYLLLLTITVYPNNIGHRLGGDIYKPENTLYAYKKLLLNFRDDKNLNHIECDIRESLDGKLIIFHDEKISRVVPRTKKNLLVLKKILVNKKFNNINLKDLDSTVLTKLHLLNDAKIPTLKEVLSISEKWKVRKPIHLEIKSLDSDQARMKLIELIKKYQNKLNISLIAYSSHFYKSFPFTKKWIKLFRKNNIIVTQLGRYNFSKIPFPISNKTFFKVIMKETPFCIKSEKKREINFSFSLHQYKSINKIYIGIFNGADDSGDKGIYWKLKTKNNKFLDSDFSTSIEWDWFEINSLTNRDFILTLEDFDTQIKGKRVGNYGIIKIIAEFNKIDKGKF